MQLVLWCSVHNRWHHPSSHVMCPITGMTIWWQVRSRTEAVKQSISMHRNYRQAERKLFSSAHGDELTMARRRAGSQARRSRSLRTATATRILTYWFHMPAMVTRRCDGAGRSLRTMAGCAHWVELMQIWGTHRHPAYIRRNMESTMIYTEKNQTKYMEINSTVKSFSKSIVIKNGNIKYRHAWL